MTGYALDVRKLFGFITDGKLIQLLLAIAFFGLFFLGPAHYEDSAGYISGEGFRSPLYPLLVTIFGFFGNYREWALIAFQLVTGYFAIGWFAKKFSSAVRLPPHGFDVFIILCATPYFGIVIKTGNAILTEGIAYPLFLITMGFLFNCLAEKRLRSAALFFLMTALLVLARKQFLFLFVIGLPLLYFLRLNGVAWVGIARLAGFLALLIPATFAVEGINGYVRHGSMIPVSYTGKQLLVGALFVADSHDTSAISNLNERRYFENLISIASTSNMTLETLANVQKQRTTNTFQHFVANYINLINIIDDTFSESYRSVYHTEAERVTMLDKTTKDLAIILIKRHTIKYGSVYVLNLIYGFGGHGIGDGYGLRGIYFFMLQLFLLIFVISASRDRPETIRIRNVVLFLSLVHWGNILEVSILEVALDRYTFYTSTIWLAVIAGLLSWLWTSATFGCSDPKD